MEAIRVNIFPPYPKIVPFSSLNRIPRACNIPVPASLVALPPMPSRIFRHPRRIAFLISSPVPNVVASIGLRFSLGISARPLAAAVSITAVFPSSDKM